MFGKKRKNEIIDEELELDDYDGELYDLDSDEVFYSEDINEIEEDSQDSSDYTSFNSVSEYDPTEDDLYDKSLQEEKELAESNGKKVSSKKVSSKKEVKDNYNSGFVGALMSYSTIIKIIGIFLMIVVIAYYLSIGRYGALVLYLILLAGAYFLGFGCMYIYTANKK